jgi:hypothetical protein
VRGNSSVLSRSQRRQASRQGILTVLLLIVVAAASFLGGFAAGRWSAPAAEVAVPAPPQRIAVTRPPAATATAPLASVPDAAVIPEGSTAAPAAPPPLPREEELTYYNTLTKGEPPPLGSGINLPPPGTPVSTAAGAAPLAVAVAGKTVSPGSAGTKEKAPAAAATAPPPAAAADKSAAGRKTVAGAGSYVVQTASFRKVADAEALKKRLAKRNLNAFVEAIEVAGKGIWHRVMLGPYATAAEAEAAAAQIKGYERMTPVVKKR